MSDNSENEKNNTEKNNIVIEGEVESSSDNNINRIIANYGGAIIGGLIAILLCFTHLYKLLLAVIVIAGGVFLGNYVQKNKNEVKTRLKELIDKF